MAFVFVMNFGAGTKNKTSGTYRKTPLTEGKAV